MDEVTWRPWPFSGGVYTFVADFDTAGTWEIAVTLDDPGGEVTGTAAIQVRQEPLAPGVGSPAPRTRPRRHPQSTRCGSSVRTRTPGRSSTR